MALLTNALEEVVASLSKHANAESRDDVPTHKVAATSLDINARARNTGARTSDLIVSDDRSGGKEEGDTNGVIGQSQVLYNVTEVVRRSSGIVEIDCQAETKDHAVLDGHIRPVLHVDGDVPIRSSVMPEVTSPQIQGYIIACHNRNGSSRGR